MTAQTEATMTYDTTQYASKRDFIETALDPEATIREVVERGEWTAQNAYEEAQDFLKSAIDLDHDRDVLDAMDADDDAEVPSYRRDGVLTAEDIGDYIMDLIAETATCDACGQPCGSQNLTAQSNGQSICGACEFQREQA